MMEGEKLNQLYRTFPKLSEEGQKYILGISEGLKFAPQKNLEKPDISLVVPCFNEEEALPVFHQKAAQVLSELRDSGLIDSADA
jgi:hypothetical protein